MGGFLLLRGSLRHALSFQTLFTALLGVAIWALFEDWWSGLLIVLLLYVHEMGHLIGALVRGVRIQQGPTFIPGLGAFVMVDEGKDYIDDLVLYLSGPLLGAVGALLVYSIGEFTDNRHLAWAGHLGLWINLVNLLPLLPFDGGRVVRWTGRIGLIVGLVAAVLIAFLTDLVGRGLIGLGLSATWRAIKQARYETPLPWPLRMVVLGVYLLAGGALFLALRLIPKPPLPPSETIPLLRPLSWGALAYCGLYLLGLLLKPWQIEGPRLRYGVLLLFGWPRLLLKPWRLLLAGQIFAATLGSADWGSVQRQVEDRVQRAESGAGEAAAWVYDALARTLGRPAADQWLSKLMPSLLVGGTAPLTEAENTLLEASQAEAAAHLRALILTQNCSPATMDPALAKRIALDLRREGHDAQALPYARRSTASDDAEALAALGKLCLELRELLEAESAYRMALDKERSPAMLLGLGEVLVRQGRIADATKLGDEALHKRITEAWRAGQPTKEEINATLQRWQEECHPSGEQ